MAAKPNNRLLSTFTLCIGLIAVTVLFGVPARYAPTVHVALAVA